MTKNINKNEVIKMYHTDGLSTRVIAKKLGVSQATIRYHLRETTLRNKSEAQKKFLENNQPQRQGKGRLINGRKKEKSIEE